MCCSVHRLTAATAIALLGVVVSLGGVSAQAPPAGGPPGLPPGRSGAPGPTSAPARDPSAKPAADKGTAAVRGRVLAADTGLPLRRARVVLNTQGPGQGRTAMTDGEGAFTFDSLPAGRYGLHVSKARYVDTNLGARRPGGAGRPVELADGQIIENLRLSLATAGVITGKVLDDVGDVVVGAMVVPMRYRTFNGERQLTPMGSPRMTDDTGAFRLFGLAPGTYYLMARADEFGRFGGELGTQEIDGFAPTYFPGTATASEAQPLEVAAGGEMVADVSLLTTRLTSISGVVLDAAGDHATGGHVMTMVNGRRTPMGGSSGGAIKPDGTFTISGVAPGEYVVQARPSFGAAPMFETPGRQRERVATASVAVSGGPVTGLRLIVAEPIRIPVSTTFEDATAAPRPERVMVSAQSERAMQHGMAMLGQDGRLALEVVPGAYRLFANAQPPWMIKRISYRGRDIEPMDEVELTAEPGGRIDVVFTTRSASASGGVAAENGKPVTDYVVMLFPADADLMRRASFHRLRSARPDQQGRFRLEHLPPGAYAAVAIEDVEREDAFDLEFIETLRPLATPVTLREGETATLTLTLAAVP